MEALPKMAEDEAALLYDLLSKVFVYDPTSRLTAREIILGFVLTGPIKSSSTDSDSELSAGFVLAQSPIEASILGDEGKIRRSRML